ncbi:MAG: zinc ribbon domain-containing protein [Ruminococcus sp.]|nr:zinc ribbon domain-containing protein [Ruminococcus sp.]
MVCKTCGAQMQEGDKFCGNCGATLAEMGIVPKQKEKQGSKEDADKRDFQMRSDYFGGVQVKERKASALASVDFKLVSIIFVLAMFGIFLLVKAYYDSRTTTIGVDDFSVTLPSSMREVNDTSFDVLTTLAHQEFANNRMEFTFAKYDAVEIIPDLGTKAMTNDFRDMEKSVVAKSKLENLERTFTQDLEDTFDECFEDYERVSMDRNQLSFTYHDRGSVDNYVKVMVIVRDHDVYQFTCMCSESDMKKYDKKFNNIFDSIKF